MNRDCTQIQKSYSCKSILLLLIFLGLRLQTAKLAISLAIVLIRRQPRLRLSIMKQELNLTTKLYLTKLDLLQLVSCRIIHYSDGPYMLKLGSPLKEFLLGKENLETLYLACTGDDDAVPANAIQSHERMPAVNELVLSGPGSASNLRTHFTCHNGFLRICRTRKAGTWTRSSALITNPPTSTPKLHLMTERGQGS